MPDLIPCIDCGVELSRDVLRAHLAQDHKLWPCRICGETIRTAIGALEVARLAVCSWSCLMAARDLGHCRRCCQPPSPDFAEGYCPSCTLLLRVPQLALPQGDPDDEPEPDERAAWLPPKYRRSGWRLDRSPVDEEEAA